MRIIRALIALIILLILVALFVVGCLLYFVDPNKIQPIIVKEVAKRSGYHVTIKSPLTWSFYPSISIVAPQIAITAPQEQTPFLTLNQVRIATKLASIWEGRQKLSGDFIAANVQFGHIKLQNLSAKLNWRHNSLALSNIDANFYDGRLQGMTNISNLNGDPRWQWDSVFTNVQLRPLLNDLGNGQPKIQISGSAHARFQGSSMGKNSVAVLQNMQANLQLSTQQGILYGIDLNYLLQNARALLHKTPVTSSNTEQTPFETMVSNATISGGILRTNDVVLNSTGFQAYAKGEISLLAKTLNLHVSVVPKEESSGLEIPVIISGPLHEPKVSLDMDEVSKMLAKIQLEKVKDRVQEEIDKRVPDHVGSILKNMIGR